MNGSDRCHGISYDRAMREGVDVKLVLNEYKNDIVNRCSMLVCHNINFDVRVVFNECAMASV